MIIGKGENVFDFMAHKTPSKIRNNENGDIAADSYHKYKEDVQMLKNASVRYIENNKIYFICITPSVLDGLLPLFNFMGTYFTIWR